MSTAVLELTQLIPKLRRTDREAIRQTLDQADHKAWQADTAKFRQLMRGKTRVKRPAGEVVSKLRR